MQFNSASLHSNYNLQFNSNSETAFKPYTVMLTWLAFGVSKHYVKTNTYLFKMVSYALAGSDICEHVPVSKDARVITGKAITQQTYDSSLWQWPSNFTPRLFVECAIRDFLWTHLEQQISKYEYVASFFYPIRADIGRLLRFDES